MESEVTSTMSSSRCITGHPAITPMDPVIVAGVGKNEGGARGGEEHPGTDATTEETEHSAVLRAPPTYPSTSSTVDAKDTLRRISSGVSGCFAFCSFFAFLPNNCGRTNIDRS